MRISPPVLTVVAFFCLMLAASLSDACAQAGEPRRGTHARIFIVPPPGRIAIDGKLDDWDLSGQVFSYISNETRDERNGRTAMMADEEALYISGQVQDSTPMMNRHDPEANPDKVWNADSLQVRIVIDREVPYPAKYTKFGKGPHGNNVLQHLLLWYYTDGKEPGLQLRKDMDYKVPEAWQPAGLVSPDGFEAVYRKTSDTSYVFEYRIPWKTLDATNPPRKGDIVSGTIQYNFSRADGLKIDSQAGWARDVVSSGGFPWQQTSCWGKFIFAQKGGVPAISAATGEKRKKPTPLVFDYDLPADGEVTVSLWDRDNVLVRNVVCQQKRKAGKVTEKWDGLDFRGKPIEPGEYTWKGVHHEPITTKFLLSVHNSGTPPYKTSDGTGGWGGDHTDPVTAEAFGDDMILAWPFGEAGWGLIRVGLDGDKKASSQRGNATCLATDAKNNRVFAANPRHAKGVRVFDGRDFRPINMSEQRGKPEQPAPEAGKSNAVSGLAYARNWLYVAYGERDLICVNDGKTGALLASWSVPEPGRLAAAKDGFILAISGQKVLRVKDGKHSLFAADHLDQPTGIAVDADGRVYVTNQGKLQNVSVFSPAGEYLKSIGKPGGRPRSGLYDPAGMLQPAGCAVDSKGRLWVAEHIDAPKRFSVWDTRTGKNADEFFGGSAYSTWVAMDPKHPDEVYCHNVLWKVNLDTGEKRPYSTLWHREDPDGPPAAPVGSSHGGGLGVLTAKNGRQYGWGHHRVLYLREGPVFKPVVELRTESLWIDANDNQRRDPNEVQPIEGFGRRGPQFDWVDADLNLYSTTSRCIWKPVEIRPDGVPVYDLQKSEELPFGAFNPQGPRVFVDPHDGSLYQNDAVRTRDQVGFARWSRDGKRLWGIRGTLFWKRTLSMPKPDVGDLYALTAPLGVAGDFTGAATYYSGYHILTRDGIYVAMIMNPPAREGLGPNKVLCELFTGRLVRLTDSGRYLLLTGDQDGRVMEVNGLDTVRKLKGGTWRMTPEMLAMVKEAQRAFQEQEKQTLVINRWRRQLEAAVPVERQLRGGLGFQARAAWDEKNLYVQYDVTSPNPLVNSVADPQSIFLGGNCLDIQIATDRDAPADRTEPAPGDLRLIVTRQNEKPVAVLFQPKVKGFRGEPIVMESPVDRETFDRITEVRDMALKYEEREGAFTAVLTVPLELLGWRPVSGMGVKMDLGYVFGDKTGRNALKRAYWANNSFEANVVDDLPDESRLNPEHWDTAVIE